MGRRWLGSVKYRAARRSYLWSDGMASATATRSEHRMASRSVRLSGIDAPKRKQHFGAEAKKAVADRRSSAGTAGLPDDRPLWPQ